MTPAARLQAVIDILAALEETHQPADRFIRDYFRARRYAGSKDRAAVTERVFEIFRHRAEFAWRMGSESPRALAIGALIAEGADPPAIAALFTGERYAPAPLDEAERAAIAAPPEEAPPLHVPGEFPAFLEAELRHAFGDGLAEEMAAMLLRAPADLRVNTLKAERATVLAALGAETIAAAPTPYAPFGIRVPPAQASSVLGRHALFEDGAFEFQDEAAQIAAALCEAGPGMRVLDIAAGTGGKTLALAAHMKNRGELVAYDIAPQRLKQAEARAARAGVRILKVEKPAGVFDRVLLDAPCSGTGTWRRQPELRWRLTPGLLAERTALQDRLLDAAAPLVARDGRLIYATCSVLPCENRDRIDNFLSRHPGFTVLPALTVWPHVAQTPPPPGLGDFLEASPLRTGTDGFFAAILVKRS